MAQAAAFVCAGKNTYAFCFLSLFFLMWFEELIHWYTHRGEHAKCSEGELEDFLSAAFGAASRASCSITANLSCMNIEYALAEQAHE